MRYVASFLQDATQHRAATHVAQRTVSGVNEHLVPHHHHRNDHNNYHHRRRRRRRDLCHKSNEDTICTDAADE